MPLGTGVHSDWDEPMSQEFIHNYGEHPQYEVGDRVVILNEDYLDSLGFNEDDEFVVVGARHVDPINHQMLFDGPGWKYALAWSGDVPAGDITPASADSLMYEDFDLFDFELA